MILPIKNKAAREILFCRIKNSKGPLLKIQIQSAWANGLISDVMTDYKEMLECLTVEDFLSVVPIKEKKEKK